RAFTQDDAHVFCRMDQVQDEVRGVLEMVERFYARFGFADVRLFLSTRPEKAAGAPEMWEGAEEALRNALGDRDYGIKEGDGAFYGPKIDFQVTDTMGRSWQLGTCQLDFYMPERFDLWYTNADDQEERPVMIHRAITGSIERFLGILIEDSGGDFPFWLAPEQVRPRPLSARHPGYAATVRAALRSAGLRAEVDGRSESVGKRIREGELGKVPYLLVAGDREAEAGSVAVRARHGGDEGVVRLDDLVVRLRAEAAG
ncbi:MAG: threonine--tRNA ligase, partial [Miltoncostaeaceae bacterium]